MRKLNKRGAGEEGYISVYLILALVVLIGGVLLYIYVVRPLMEKQKLISGGDTNSLSNINLACDVACAQSDNIAFCSNENSVVGMTTAQEEKLIAKDKCPKGIEQKICADLKAALTASPQDATVLATARQAYTTAKGANKLTFEKITCDELRQPGVELVKACSGISC